jgi:hypothetical protein
VFNNFSSTDYTPKNSISMWETPNVISSSAKSTDPSNYAPPKNKVISLDDYRENSLTPYEKISSSEVLYALKDYEVENHIELQKFLLKRPILTRFIESAFEKIKKYYDNEVKLYIALIDNTASVEDFYVQIDISSKCSDVDTCLSIHNQILDDWWINDVLEMNQNIVLGII